MLLAVGVTVSMWVAARVTPPGRVPRSELGNAKATLIGVLMWGGYLLVLWALSFAPLSVVAPARETAVVGVAIWGVWRLHESRAAALKLSGAAATLVGVSLLAF
jgi:drug/metabolite transporter (DMT)-like permease